MIIVKTDVGELDSRVFLYLGPVFKKNIVRVSQVSHNYPALQVNCRQQISIILLTNKGGSYLFLMIVYNLGLWGLFVGKGDLPQLYRLICRGRDQHLLVAIICRAYLLAEHTGDVIFMRRKLLHGRTLIETEQVYLVVHAG